VRAIAIFDGLDDAIEGSQVGIFVVETPGQANESSRLWSGDVGSVTNAPLDRKAPRERDAVNVPVSDFAAR
jgi:hypothetical protein